MKQQVQYSFLWLQLLFAAAVGNAQPGWVVDPAAYQYSMTMVAQIQVDGTPNHLLNNHLAVYREGQIRGYGTPVGFNGQAYYFLNLFSNNYKGDTLCFRAFLEADHKVYESVDTVVFLHHLALGKMIEPFQVRLHLGDRPLIYSLPETDYLANGCAQVVDVEASDNQNSEGNGLIFSISGGADAARFEIDPLTGLLSWFNFLPDPAMPADANSDNRYEVEVRVTDTSGLFDVQRITVTVLPGDNAPSGPLVCPAGQTLNTSADGTGNCGTTADATTIALPDLCAENNLVYEMSGATPGSGNGQVPENQVFAVGLTSIYYFLNGQECVFTIQVEDDEPPVISCPADQTVSPDISDPCSAAVGNIDAGFGDNCSGATLEYALSGATNGGGAGQASGQTFNFGTTTAIYTATDGAGLTSSCQFSVTVTSCSIDFSGQIIFSNDNTLGVKDANVSLTGSANGTDLTDPDGNFFISTNLGSGSFTLTPAKTVNKLNGVTSSDVTAIQQHIANITPITDPYKLVAADVNKSNSVTSLDATIVNQSLLGNPSALAQFKTSWRFVPASHVMQLPPWGFPENLTYTNINTPQTGQDFYGIKTGDVVVTFADPANFGGETPLILQETDRLLMAGESLTVSFAAGQTDDLAAFQCAFRFDPAQLKFLEIQPATALPITPDNFGTYNIDEGEIRLVWAQPVGESLPEGSPIFNVQFTALQSGAKLSEVIHLDESELPALAYTSALAESKVALKFIELTDAGVPASTSSVQLFKNRPNPFSGETTIEFMLPESCEARLRVLDATGRELLSINNIYPAGKNHEVLHLESAATLGVVYCELITPRGVVTRKMLALKN